MAEILDQLWTKVRVLSGACASSIEVKHLNDYLEKGEQAARIAAYKNIFSGSRTMSNRKLEEAADAIAKVREPISKAQNVCKNLQAVIQIHDAIKVLNDPQSMRPGSDEAARAFGQLFVGAGKLAEKLPPPANTYAPILLNCGDFFVNVQRGLVPTMKGGEQGRAMRRVLREIDSQ